MAEAEIYCLEKYGKSSNEILTKFEPSLFLKSIDFIGKEPSTNDDRKEYIYKTCDLQIKFVKKIEENNEIIRKNICFYYEKNIKDLNEEQEEELRKEISQLLRGSNTWYKKDGENKNYFISDDGNTIFVFSASNFGVIGNFYMYKDKERINISKEYFQNALRLRALAEAYNTKADDFIETMANSFSRDNLTKMCKVRDEIYEFDFVHYFENPISLNSFFYVRIWEYFVKFLRVKEKHNEMKIQISELVNIIEVREKQKQEESNKKQADKLGTINTRIGWIAILIAIITLFADEIKPHIKTYFNQAKNYLFTHHLFKEK